MLFFFLFKTEAFSVFALKQAEDENAYKLIGNYNKKNKVVIKFASVLTAIRLQENVPKRSANAKHVFCH